MVDHNFSGIPRVGDIWKEVDPRSTRLVRVEHVGSGRRSVKIITVVGSHLRWIMKPRSKFTYADIERFHGKRGGYALHHREWPG